MTQELVLIRGLPGSGKSTRAKVYAKKGYKHFEADDLFTYKGRYKYDPTRIKEAHMLCQGRAAGALEKGHSVVVANTFVKRWEMQPYILMAERVGALCRIEEATGTWRNVHRVPEEVIERMRGQWEPWNG